MNVPQQQVNAYCQSQSSYWEDIYSSSGVQGEIYRDRQAAVLAWIDSLALVPGSKVLEIGCGAGFMADALPQRGIHVPALHPTKAMVALGHQPPAEAGNPPLSSFAAGGGSALTLYDGGF